MQYFQQLFDQSQSGGLWAIGSLLLFLLFFAVMIYIVTGLSKGFVDQMKNFPLLDEDTQDINTEKNLHHE